jgi:hypothetical protein
VQGCTAVVLLSLLLLLLLLLQVLLCHFVRTQPQMIGHVKP